MGKKKKKIFFDEVEAEIIETEEKNKDEEVNEEKVKVEAEEKTKVIKRIFEDSIAKVM